MNKQRIPIVDLFAGPGGLGEGFSSACDSNGNKIFQIRLSIEKDEVAHRTLTLRSLFRALAEAGKLDLYYQYIQGRITHDAFYQHSEIIPFYNDAKKEARCLELGNDPEGEIDKLIGAAISGHDDWILIGGPPCQAYSLAGRSRRINDPAFATDPKHLLYREYLRVIQQFKPTVFVMENVKGMLSAQHNGQLIFKQIIKDLTNPAEGLEYEIRSFVVDADKKQLTPDQFTICSEKYGIPQMRHRVILLGIAISRANRPHEKLKEETPVSVEMVIGNLPKIRSKVSARTQGRGNKDSHEARLAILAQAESAVADWQDQKRRDVVVLMKAAVKDAHSIESTGAAFISYADMVFPKVPKPLTDWYVDKNLHGVCQHEARGHMDTDLHRYLFASCFAAVGNQSPKLSQFPKALLPAHKNASADNIPFDDRFRVQVKDLPATTVVSHIAKDGHYYIHPDPAQCRSFSVREAARLQTFPDNYFFEGNKTQQYHQVGNAVPPFLAKQLAQSVADFLRADVTTEGHPSAKQNDFFSVSAPLVATSA